MVSREKRLAIILGTVVGLGALYKIVDAIAISPYRQAVKDIKAATEETAKYNKVVNGRGAIIRGWESIAGRTFSYDVGEVRNQFEQELKRLAGRHNLKKATFTPRSGSSISRKPDIYTEAYVLSGEGEFNDVVAFLRDLYRSPYLCQVSTLSVAPFDPKQGRNRLKIDQMVVETPRLPKLEAVEKRERDELARMGIKGNPKTMVDLAEPPTEPARRLGAGDADFALLAERNIFRMYQPPPTNTVKIDNDDRLDVAVTIRSFWDGKESEQLVRRVAGKKKDETVSVTGDVFELNAIYADGTKAPGARFDSKTPGPWVMRISAHTPAETVTVALDNQDEHPVDVGVTVMDAENKPVVKPTIRVPGKGKVDLDTYVAKGVRVAVTYASGKAGGNQTFMPKDGKQTFVIQVEPAEPMVEVVKGPEVPPPPPPDPEPDPDLKVTGRWMYGEHHEMFAMNTKTNTRVIFARGDDVDGGVLIAAHPEGGVVHMKATGHYYLYPIGKMFTDRILLEGVTDPKTDLQAVIEAALTKREAMEAAVSSR